MKAGIRVPVVVKPDTAHIVKVLDVALKHLTALRDDLAAMTTQLEHTDPDVAAALEDGELR